MRRRLKLTRHGPRRRSVGWQNSARRRRAASCSSGARTIPPAIFCWDKPVKGVCPERGYVGAEAKSNKTRGEYRRCLKCGNEWDVVKVEEEASVA